LGADRFVFDNLDQADTVTDFTRVQNDKIDFSGVLSQFDSTDVAVLSTDDKMLNGKVYFENVNFIDFESSSSMDYLQANFKFANDGVPSQQNVVVLNGTVSSPTPDSAAGIYHLTDLNNNGSLDIATEVTFLGTVEDTTLAQQDLV
jgi:hypothetical protein